LATLLVLLGIASALLILGAAARLIGTRVPAIQAALCTLGLVAALFTQTPATLQAGPFLITSDPLACAILLALFILGACNAARPALLGVVVLAPLAADGIGLVLLVGVAALLSPASRLKPILPAALAIALLAVAWHATLPDPRFAIIRTLPPETIAAPVTLLATLIAVAILPVALPAIPGALVALYLLARLLLDLAGPATPGWWGIPVIVLAAATAAVMARRFATAEDLPTATTSAIGSALALAAAGIGVALLARGADLPPLGALAVAATLLLLLATSAWGGLMLLAGAAIHSSTGTSSIARLGGLLPRTPTTGLAMLTALASVAALPLSAGFSALWLLVQAVLGISLLGAARLGGTAMLTLSAAAAAAIGVTVAILAAGALRLAGTILLGTPRSAKAAAATQPGARAQLGMAILTLASLAIGLLPGPLLLLMQPVTRMLTGVAAEGAGPWSIASTLDSPGYAAPIIAALLGLCCAGAAWAGRGPRIQVPTWRGGLAEDAPARANTDPWLPWPIWRPTWHTTLSPSLILSVLALILAATFGWAIR
jgi:formate hydrogenlyase subunit 3/multisubunit Na+/H+ antiporter MnhD subunit